MSGAPNGSDHAFTLVELLAVLAILGLLAGMVTPAIEKARAKTENVVCVSNLRQIGTAVWLYVPENGNRFPSINNPWGEPIFTNGQTMLEALGTYGLTEKVLACPADMRSSESSYRRYTNSYEYVPWSSEEETAGGTATVYRGNSTFEIPFNRLTLCWDVSNVHEGGFNALRADNTVRSRSAKPKFR